MKINLGDKVSFIDSYMTLTRGVVIKIERNFIFNRYWIENSGNIYIINKKKIVKDLD